MTIISKTDKDERGVHSDKVYPEVLVDWKIYYAMHTSHNIRRRIRYVRDN